MDNEVPLPPPRRIQQRSPATHGASTGPGTRTSASSLRKSRRLSRFDDRSSQPSSDPALFSSDDIPASGLENYHAPVTAGNSGSRKRRYRGTWWGEQAVDPNKRKRAEFKEKRYVDSGVWMGSDESSVAESLLLSSEGDAPGCWGEDLLKTALESRFNGRNQTQTQLRGDGPLQMRAANTAAVAFKGPEESAEHRYAREVVNDCLEKGNDSVDLGNLHMRSIPSGLLRPLQHLTKLPSVNEAPISENVFTSLQPFLRIFLSNNSLLELHPELFELNNLKVLSVRNNKLSEIPPTISRLTALQDLNVSVNRLSHLPWELLWLVRQGELKHLIVRPNSFISIEEAQIAEWHSRSEGEEHDDEEPHDPLQLRKYNEGDTPVEAWAPIHVATGPTIQLNMEGKPMPDRSIITPETTTNSPSLREVALRAVAKLPALDQVSPSELAEYPALVIPLLQRAKEVRATGGRVCSVCKGNFVIPRSEWVEWWDCTPHENGLKRPRASAEMMRPLPFRRVGCSWACVPGGGRRG
ncbi:Leucine-rich repeat typical subtype [Penicillium lagena]|uniref:Leucine-rich repeat typical subtype n=1 Tax=Penicillium lagena TaxID=94218 RepID=UPI00253F6706|nr:Leucine-rich repeat typical subtype [Penicillium lagena]KAJ5601339.1 Leucine-rich repeat typical subtype [Penicillium lagena]